MGMRTYVRACTYALVVMEVDFHTIGSFLFDPFFLLLRVPPTVVCGRVLIGICTVFVFVCTCD